VLAWRIVAYNFSRAPCLRLSQMAIMAIKGPDAKVVSVICSICGKPIPLSDCKTDDRQRPVHENCYVAVTLAQFKNGAG
jgi:hypothetical protein